MIDKSKLTDAERDLVEGFDGLLDDLRSDVPIEKKYTCRRVVLELEPHSYTAAQVKSTRKLLNASQALFAQFLGVSVKAVRSWERGSRPSPMACRFMDEIRRDPEYWRARLKDSIKVRTAECSTEG